MVAIRPTTSKQAYRAIVQKERETKRTSEQNRLMWALLQDVADQKMHAGRHYSKDEWKVLFLHGLGQEIKFLLSLDEQSFVPYGRQSTHDLTLAQMSELIEFIRAWGAQNGIKFRDEQGLTWDAA